MTHISLNLISMKCNIIGAGRLGKQLAMAIDALECIDIAALCNQNHVSSFNALKECGLKNTLALHSVKALPLADAIFITVPDDQITVVVKALEQSDVLQAGCFIIHCSGVLASRILSPLQAKGCQIASLHPLKAFKKGAMPANAFFQVDCIIEGDDAVVEWLTSLCHQLKAYPARIAAGQKPAYHAAAVIASNYMVTLADTATQLMGMAGLKQQDAFPMIRRLMQSSLNNLMDSNEAKEALTGPISRGDQTSVASHLQAIKPQVHHELYKAMGLATLPLTALTDEKKQALAQLLQSEI